MVNNIKCHLKALQWGSKVYSCKCLIYKRVLLAKCKHRVFENSILNDYSYTGFPMCHMAPVQKDQEVSLNKNVMYV